MPSYIHAAWEQIFADKQFDVLADVHYVSSAEIKRITGKEPRNLAKIDSSKDTPNILRQHGYIILPIGGSDYSYALVRANGFHTLEDAAEAQNFTSRVRFSLAAAGRGTSEMQYLDYCQLSGVIEDVIGRGTLYPIIRGREGSGVFNFEINHHAMHVLGAQIEVDLGLEGEDCIVLLEAKSKTPKDFITRQLYYPYRKYTNLAPGKTIIPVFFTYDARLLCYNFWVYEFTNTTSYDSLHLVSTHSYHIIESNHITVADITPVASVYQDIIPQANDLGKVLELIFTVSQGVTNATDMAAHFGFTSRQSSYYREAAEALGFISRTGNTYQLTEAGTQLMSLPTQPRNLYFARVISNFSLVQESLELVRSQGSLTKQDLQPLIASRGTLTGSTIGRRADSLYAWLMWIANNTGALKANGRVITLD